MKKSLFILMLLELRLKERIQIINYIIIQLLEKLLVPHKQVMLKD